MPPLPVDPHADETNPTPGSVPLDPAPGVPAPSPAETDPTSPGETKPAGRSSASRPRRRWWRFSLRRAMVLIVVVAGPIGWESNRVARMRRAVAVWERPVVGEQVEAGSRRRPLTDAELAPQARVNVFYQDAWQDGRTRSGSRLGWVPGWFRRAVGDDHFRVVSELFFRRRPTPDDWAAIATLGSPVGIKFAEAGVVDDDLRGMGGCPRIQRLDLSGTRITDAALAEVGRLPNLLALDLSDTQVTDAASAAIGGLRTLRELDLARTKLTDRGLAPLTALANLEVLRCGSAGTDAGLVSLRGLPHLRILHLTSFGSGVSDAGLTLIGQYRDLEELSVAVYGISEVGLKELVALPKLRKLSLMPAYRDNIALDLIAIALGREAEVGETIGITPAGLEQIGHLQRLESLDLSLAAINDSWLRAIGRLHGLRELAIDSSRISDGGLEPLARLTQLEDLRLGGRLITDAGLKLLDGLTRLDTLDLNCPKMTDAGLDHLRPLTRLTLLWIGGQVTAEGVGQLRTHLPGLATILRH